MFTKLCFRSKIEFMFKEKTDSDRTIKTAVLGPTGGLKLYKFKIHFYKNWNFRTGSVQCGGPNYTQALNLICKLFIAKIFYIIFRFLKLPVMHSRNCGMQPLADEDVKLFRMCYGYLKLIIIDEVSMVCLSFLDYNSATFH